MKRVLFIVGPTAVGKTEVALELADSMHAEIVSCDSRQVYRFMDIGTAKPTADQLSRIPHHFIDIKDPNETYSAGEYGADAREAIEAFFSQGKTPIVVGGSGLYIRALVDGLFGPKISDPAVKNELRARLDDVGLRALFQELHKIDPVTAARLHATDSQRILRALEVFQITGRPFSEYLRKKTVPANFEPFFVGLTLARERLYAKIESRVEHMLELGLIDEVKGLLNKGYGAHLTALQSVGYKEAIRFLNDELTYKETTDLIKQKTRNYAKRQFTWFRKDMRITWYDVDSFAKTTNLVSLILREFR
ncbi:MAG: tRNA (adenosine(37)-N6)-dimethylallyltransferase MiaA [bacterium]